MMKALSTVCFFAFASFAAGNLEWERVNFVHEAPPGEQMVTAVFPFTNTGTAPVTIRNMQSTCGCTVAELEKRTYEPGESGEIKAVFSYGGRMGRQVKQVRVFSSDRTQPTVLQIDVTIPTMVELSPRILYWRTGQEWKPQEVTIRLNTTYGVEITEIVSHDQSFSHELQPTDEPGVFRLVVSPPESSDRRRMGRIDLRTNVTGETVQTHTVFLGIH